MPHATINGLGLYYDTWGAGPPLVFVHEFGGDCRSWRPQVRFLARRFRAVAYNARGYPPSAVPDDPAAYSQELAVQDLRGLLDCLAIPAAHICGLSMGSFTTLLFGLAYPERALSLTVAGCGYGSGADRAGFREAMAGVAQRLLEDGMARVADAYAQGPARLQFLRKDPDGWREFHDWLAAGSPVGRTHTLLGIQARRPSVYDLEPQLAALRVPTLILVGDEDEPALEPSLFLKRTIPGAGLAVFPNSGHTINLEEPDLFNRTLLDFLTAVEAGCWPCHPAQAGGTSGTAPNPCPGREP